MPPKRRPPVTFDEYLGRVVEGAANSFGGRDMLYDVLPLSTKSVDRRIRGEVPFYVSEMEIIAAHTNTTSAVLVQTALSNFGGLEKLLAETVSEDSHNVTDEDKIPYIGKTEVPTKAAANTDERAQPKD